MALPIRLIALILPFHSRPSIPGELGGIKHGSLHYGHLEVPGSRERYPIGADDPSESGLSLPRLADLPASVFRQCEHVIEPNT